MKQVFNSNDEPIKLVIESDIKSLIYSSIFKRYDYVTVDGENIKEVYDDVSTIICISISFDDGVRAEIGILTYPFLKGKKLVYRWAHGWNVEMPTSWTSVT